MPIYEFECDCGHVSEKLMSFSDVKPTGVVDKSITCDKCSKKGLKRIMPSKVFGYDGVSEPWQYDYTHHVKPKYVKDSKGNRHKFNPNVHQKGRKGSG